MMMRGQPPMGYQMMPVNGQGRGGPAGAGGPGPRRGGGAGGRGGQQGPRGPPNGSPQGQQGGQQRRGPLSGPGVVAGQQGPKGASFQYEAGVRNQRAPVQAAAEVAGHSEPVLPTQAGESLTIKALAAAPEKQQKQIIGEQLFPRIKLQEPNLAGKITGMLLEMDNGELIHLLESAEALNEKIQEAKEVLQQHEGAAADAE